MTANPTTGGLIDGANMPTAPGSVACMPGALPSTTRLQRLTHPQYDNSIRDLFGVLTVKPLADLPQDQNQAGFDRGLDLQVGETLGKSYRTLAENVAALVVANPMTLQGVLGCDPKTGDACARTFITGFGKKAFRRPLLDDEITRYLALFKKAPMLVESGDDFNKGARVVIESLLQSPHFLYRVELSAKPDGMLLAPSSHEIASRLSFMLVNTTPDGALMAAADMNQLMAPDVVAIQARRLLDTPAGRETMKDFHDQWLQLDYFANKVKKDPKKYATWKESFAPALQQEVLKFVDAVVFDQKKGLSTLLTAPFTFVTKDTAPFYGLPQGMVTSSSLTRVDLDPTRRAGILTQVGFLASHAYAGSSSPIHRGTFIQRTLLCAQIPDPPANVPALPPLDTSMIKTTRDLVTKHTEPPECKGCHHALINPPGFGLENFDAVGSWRDDEAGNRIDASGTVAGGKFTGPVELAKVVAGAAEARTCYADAWVRYAFGRSATAGDKCAIEALGEKLKDDKYTARDLLVDLVRTRAFMNRVPEVAP